MISRHIYGSNLNLATCCQEREFLVYGTVTLNKENSKADLNAGVGEPCAGQARLKGCKDFSVKTNPELFSENFGADPPTGSVIQSCLKR